MICTMLCRWVLALSIAVFFAFCIPASAADISRVQSPYSQYHYEKNGKTIYFGTQPLAAPMGVVQAVMQRDLLLERALLSRGQKLMFYPFFKGPDINIHMQRGDIDMTMAGDAPVLQSAAMSDIVVLALAKQGASSLVARKTMGSLRALHGRRIGYPAGSTAELGLLIALSTIGLDARSVTLSPMDVSDMVSALLSGHIDAFAAFEPTPALALAAHPELKVYAKFLNTSYLYANRAFLDKQPQAAEQILAAYVRAVRWMQASDRNLSQAISWSIGDADVFLGRTSGMRAPLIKGIVINDLLRFGDPVLPVLAEADQGHLGKMYRFMQERGSIDRNISWTKVQGSINSLVMKRILADPKRFQLNTFSYTVR